MTKNKLSDLNDHLFCALERLSDEELSGEALSEEIGRTKAIEVISRQVIDNARVGLEAARFMSGVPRADARESLPESMRK